MFESATVCESRRNVARDHGPINETRTGWGQTVTVVAGAATLSALAVAVDWVVRPPRPGLPPVAATLAVFFAVFAIMSAFAVWTASSLGLPSFLLLSPLSGRRRWLRFGIYGVGAGFVIYLSNGALSYLATDGSPPPATAVYQLDNHLKVFTLSARAALSEETMYRLFAIPFVVSLGMRFYGWRPRFGFETGPPAEPVRTPRRLVVIALIVSALMFGMAHDANPVAACLFGLVLGVSFLRGGWESAVTAHFLGNYLLFAGIYL